MPTKSPFVYRALEQHYAVDYSAPDAVAREKEILGRAAAMGLNRVMIGETWPDLGVRLVDYRETLPELATAERMADVARRRAAFGEIVAEAQRLGIEVWPSLNVINYPDEFMRLFPDAAATAPVAADRWLRLTGARGLSKQPQMCPSSTSFQRLVSAQVEELGRLPGVAGVECWFSAGDSDLFYCVCERCAGRSVSDRLVDFAQVVFPVCERLGKKLSLRCYLGGWRCALETEAWREAAPRIPAGVEICFKQVHGDLMNWHGSNPLAGELAAHAEMVEFDVQGEYRGTNYGMVCSVRWQLRDLIRHFRDRGVTSIACRGLDRAHPFDVDKWLFGALAADPDLDVAAWCEAWAGKKYGAAGGEVLAILDEAAEIMRLSMYVRGVQWASWAVPQNLARLRFILFDRCAPCVSDSYLRLQPTAANIAAIGAEKDEARRRVTALVPRVVALGDKLDRKFHAPLLASISYLGLYVAVAGPLMEVFFRFLAWEQTSSEVTREYARLPLLTAIARAQKALHEVSIQLEQIDATALASLMDTAGFVKTKPADKFREPFGYAAGIVEEIAREIDKPSASWWAYFPMPEQWPAALRERTELYRSGGDC
jgi:hypothetical protein